jgi:hypothetical protein
VSFTPVGAFLGPPDTNVLVAALVARGGYRHEAVTPAMVTIERLGKETGNLDDFDFVVFYNRRTARRRPRTTSVGVACGADSSWTLPISRSSLAAD